MPVSQINAALTGISTGLLGVGIGLLVLTMAFGGIAMFFSWFDTHIGGLIKKILISALGGSAMLGSAGAMGLWLGGLFGFK